MKIPCNKCGFNNNNLRSLVCDSCREKSWEARRLAEQEQPKAVDTTNTIHMWWIIKDNDILAGKIKKYLDKYFYIQYVDDLHPDPVKWIMSILKEYGLPDVREAVRKDVGKTGIGWEKNI